MLRFLTLILSSTLLFSTCFSQQNQKPLLTGDIVKDVHNLLPQAEVTVDIFDGVKQSKRQVELMEKFKLGYKPQNQTSDFSKQNFQKKHKHQKD